MLQHCRSNQVYSWNTLYGEMELANPNERNHQSDHGE